jgi:hypothetical protein
MINQVVMNRVDQFDTKHGEFVNENGWLYFEDGAGRDSNPLGALMEPPKNPKELARLQVIYWEIKLQRADTEIADLRATLKNSQNEQYLREGKAALLKYQGVVKELRQQLAAARTRFEFPGMTAQQIATAKQNEKEYRKAASDRLTKIHQLQSEIEAIKI